MAIGIIAGDGIADGIIADGTTVDASIPTTMAMPIMDGATIRTIAGITGARDLASTSTSDAAQPVGVRFARRRVSIVTGSVVEDHDYLTRSLGVDEK